MAFAAGVAKQLRYKAESAWGTAPGATGAQLLRRVESTLALQKATYQSNEIRSDYQVADFRHGVRSVGGAVNGELSPATYEDFIAAALRRAFTAVSNMTGLSLTIGGSGPTYTVTRGSGSWITDGVKNGNVVRITAGAFNAANLNKNLFVLSLTATVLTVAPLNGVALVAEGPIASATVTVPGKKTYAPTTGHTDPSFAIEHYHADITRSELFLGSKLNRLGIALPATGIATVNMDFMGKDVTAAGSEYFTTPTAETSFGVLAAVNGLLAIEGALVTALTSFSLDVAGNMSAEAVVGSNTYQDIAEGRVVATGQFSALFESGTIPGYFIDETEIGITVALATGSSAAADFMTFSFPRVKVGSSDPDDGEKNLVRTYNFQALYNSAGGAAAATEQSTMAVQDSQA